jgi:hypothetical protein
VPVTSHLPSFEYLMMTVSGSPRLLSRISHAAVLTVEHQNGAFEAQDEPIRFKKLSSMCFATHL